MSRVTGITVALFVFACCAPSAQAAPIITFEYTATGNGGTVTGTFGYDAGVADGQPASSSFGEYLASGFITGTVSGGPQDTLVMDVMNLDWGVFVNSSYHALIVPNSGTSVFLEDTDSNAFLDVSLPTSLDLSGFETRELAISSSSAGGPTGQWKYEIQSISLQNPVPEPGTLVLCGAALVGFGIYWRRRSAA